MQRLLIALAFAHCASAAFAQQVGVPPTLEVQRLAPQLVPFLGTAANFQSVVNGLAFGLPVTVTTVGADGFVRTVSFTPTGVALTPLQIAQTLEAARQELIGRGIAAPTAEQLATTLVGGTLPTAVGAVQVTGILPGSVVTSPAVGGTPPGVFSTPSAADVQRIAPQLVAYFTPANFQALVSGLSLGQPVTLTTVGANGVTQAFTFTPPAGALQAQQIAQTLEAARRQLVALGISNPTAPQIAAVLVGGAVPTAGGSATVNGVITPPVGATAPSAAAGGTAPPPTLAPTRNVSDSVRIGVSDSAPRAGQGSSPR